MTTAHVVSSTSAWTFVRSSIEESTARFVALLRPVEDGSSPAVGARTAAETAAHVLVACEVDSFAAGGREPPREFADLADAFLGAGVRDVALLNQQTLERERESGAPPCSLIASR